VKKANRIKMKAECKDCNDQRSEHCQPFSHQEMDNALKALSLKTSPGPDKISNEHLKHLGKRAKEVLLHLVNLSWEMGWVPASWRIARIQPLLKPGKPSDELGSLRPIALTSCVANLMERLVQRRLVWLAETNGWFSRLQAGFRKKTINS